MSIFKKNKNKPDEPVGFEQAQKILSDSRKWYQRQYQKVTQVAFIEAIIILLLVLAVIILSKQETKTVYFAVDENLKIIKLESLSEPLYTIDGVMDFAASTIRRTFILDYLSYKETLSAERKHYSTRAFDSLITSLKNTKVIAKIKEERLTTSCALLQAPRLMKSFTLKGRVAWKIEIPVIISYESSHGVVLTQRLIADVLVIRADMTKVPKGIIIQQLILKDFKL